MSSSPGWWCPTCQDTFELVTFEENCQACGTFVGDKQPPDDAPSYAELAARVEEMAGVIRRILDRLDVGDVVQDASVRELIQQGEAVLARAKGGEGAE